MKFFLIIISIFLLFDQSTEAQVFRKKSAQQKVAEDLKKRQRAAGEDNPFEDIKSSRPNNSRDDYIWSAETAYTSLKKTGNISITSPSRYGLGNNFELSTMLPENYLAPNLILKKSYPLKKIILAHRHALYSPTPGLNWAQKKDFNKIVEPNVNVPFILALRNEFIASYPLGGDTECDKGPPFLILTGGLALDYGYSFDKDNLKHINEHIFGSRSPALTGQGAYLTARLRVDARLTDNMLIGGDVKFFYGDFVNNNFALEQHTGLQFFLLKNLTFSIGYLFSYGHFGEANFKILPFADLTFYFGKKKSRAVGLFKPGTF